MRRRRVHPGTVFVRGSGLSEGLDWGFWLAACVFWIVELDLGPFELVLMGVVLEASVLLAETPTGVVADMMSRRRSVVISQYLMGIGFIWAVISTNYWLILPAQAVFGIGWTFRSGADTAWVTDELKGSGEYSDRLLDRLLIQRHRFGLVVGVVSITATMAVGWLTTVRWAAVGLGVAHLGVGLWCQLVMTEEHFVSARRRSVGFVDTLRQGLRAVSSRPRLRVLVLVIVVMDLGSEAYDRLGAKHFLDSADLDAGSTAGLGLLFLVLAAAGLAVNALTWRMMRRGLGPARLAVVLLCVAAVGGFAVSLTSLVLVIAVGYMLQDSCREALWPVLEGWANRDAPSEARATVHSLMGQATAVGDLVGALLLGVVAELTSIPLALRIAAGLFALAGVLATRGFASRDEPDPEDESDPGDEPDPEDESDPGDEPDEDAEPDQDAVRNPDAEPDPDSERNPDAEPDADAEPDPEDESDLGDEPDVDLEPPPEPEPDPDAEPDLGDDADPDDDADPEGESDPDDDADSDDDADPELESSLRQESFPES